MGDTMMLTIAAVFAWTILLFFIISATASPLSK